jgi:hypothetical protein
MDWYLSKYRTLWCIEYPDVNWPAQLDWCLLAQAELMLRGQLNRDKARHTALTLWQESELHKRDTVITDYNLINWPNHTFNLAPEEMYLWLLLNWVVNKRHTV